MYEVLSPGPQHLSKASAIVCLILFPLWKAGCETGKNSRGICGPASLVYAISLSLKVLGLKDQYLGIPLATVLAHTYIMVTHILVTLLRLKKKVE